MNQNLLIVDDEKDILSWLEELFRFEAGMDLDVYMIAYLRQKEKGGRKMG